MSQNTFVFGAGPGQAAPAFPSQHQQSNTPSVAPAPTTPARHSTAFQQNAQLPGIDMSALAGVSPSQVALIARLLQTGTLPMPPPPPTAPVQASAATASSIPSTLQPVIVQQEDADMDREEGEVEEGEADSTPIPPPREPKAIPTGPRNAIANNASRRDTRGRQTGKTPPRRFSSSRNSPQQNRKGTGVDDYTTKEKQSKDFVLAMHQAGYSYRQLAEMVDNPQPLRRLFKSLGLPVSSDYGLSNNVHTARDPRLHAVSPSPTNSFGKLSAAEDSQKPSATKTPAPPKPAAKADRSAYLAKLQALKAGKAGPAATQPTPPSTAGAPLTTLATQQTASPSAQSAATSTPTSKAVKTELARQRLEAFKAERAAMQQNRFTSNGLVPVSNAAYVPTASQTADPPSHMISSQDGLGAGLNGIAAILGQQPSPAATQETPFPITSEPVFSPTSPPPSQSLFSPTSSPSTRSFSGLPGLFMNGTRQQVSSQPTRTASQPITQAASITQQSPLPRKRLVTADFASVPTQVKRPFGQSRSASEDESFIIENSDDEDGDSRMDLDAAPSAVATRIEPHPNAPSLQGFSSKPGFQQVSAPGTPGASTPGGITYEQQVKAIEELNRKIAEKEAKAKAQGRTPVPRADATAAPSGLPGISMSSRTATLPPTQAQAAPPILTTATPERPASAAALKLKQQKEDLTRRLAELENARRQTGVPPPPPFTSTSSPPSSKLSHAKDNEGGASSTAGLTVPAPTANAGKAASEDGESEDDSDFDFYGDEELVDPSKPSESHEHVGSQATTVSHVTEADELTDRTPLTRAADPAQLGLTDFEAEIVDQMTNEMDEDIAVSVINSGPAEIVAEDIVQPLIEAADGIEEDASESIQAQPTPPDSDVEMGSEVGDSDDSSFGDHNNDLNAPLELATVEPRNEDTTALDATLESVNAASANGEEGNDVDDDVESSDASSTRPSDSDSDEYEPEPANEQANNSLVLQDAKMADDDLASELQPSEEEQAATEPLGQQLPEGNPKVYYKPYDSILTRFKDYRYHPQYLQLVPTGYRSRTYNHQIDALNQLCQTETQGGICRDRDCGGQHFDKMGISDNVLLQQMGTKNIPAHGPDETQRWNAGLQEVIKGLKAANVRDAITIAARIADYRREFVKDPTRVIFP